MVFVRENGNESRPCEVVIDVGGDNEGKTGKTRPLENFASYPLPYFSFFISNFRRLPSHTQTQGHTNNITPHRNTKKCKT